MMGGDKMTIGEKILKYRAEHNLTQKEMAKLLDVKDHIIYRAEAGLGMHKARAFMLNQKLDELERGK